MNQPREKSLATFTLTEDAEPIDTAFISPITCAVRPCLHIHIAVEATTITGSFRAYYQQLDTGNGGGRTYIYTNLSTFSALY